MSYITAIGTANPAYCFSQSDIADFMLRAMRLGNGDERKLKTIFRASGIEYRYSVLEDYGKKKNYSFFTGAENPEYFPSTSERLRAFQENALVISCHAVKNLLSSAAGIDLKEVTHLITVCCTGMYAPGLDIGLVKHLGLPTTVRRTAINFMGCYAAFNALKAADAFCKSDPAAKVLIVCTELCSLHFQPGATDDNLLANALFADGSAAVLVETDTKSRLKLKLECFHSDLSKEGTRDMAWTVGDMGFEMKLSSYVPDIIKGGIAAFTDVLLARASKKISDIRYFAIHPGGKRILEVIEKELGLAKEQNLPARRVLQRYGNMSSATVLFVLKEIVTALTRDDCGHYILSFAFGPGLTLESMLLSIEEA